MELQLQLQDKKRMCNAEFGISNNNNDNHRAHDEDWDILNMLDLPMESLEGDGFAEDWAQLGPIPSEVLTELEYPLLSNKISQQQCHQASFRAPSPNSVLESRSSSSLDNKGVSFGVELEIPVRTRTKRLRPTVNPWLMSGFILLPNKDKKRKKHLLNNNNVEKEYKKCAHCEITKTPQWREGPMGPKTLCNACGVRYRTGRLYPEYRPAASPTFVPALHSNSHRKVIEMRQKAFK